MKPLLPHLPHLDDEALLTEVPRLARSERTATVELVARLAELDERHLYLGLGFSSLFAFGSLSLTTLRKVAPHVSDTDRTLLEAAAGKTCRQVQELLVAKLPEQPGVSVRAWRGANSEQLASMSAAQPL